MKLSIIIPYFKTYELTCLLLNKIIPQMTKEVEIFLIDDGCNENRLDKYQNIDIIHLKENVGAGMARNVGIRRAKGDYIAFIDSDDLITDDYIDILLNTIDSRDEQLIYFAWQDMNTNEVIRYPNNPAVWKCIYRKEIIPLFVEEKHLINEDVPFNNKICSREYSKYYIDKVLYLYNSNRIGSLTWELKHK